MSIATLELFRSLLVAAVLVYVVSSGKKLRAVPGWRSIVLGLALIFLSTLVSFLGYPLELNAVEIRPFAEYLIFFERI